MAKVKSSLGAISGKINGDVYVNSKRYGSLVRKAPRAGSRKEEAALKQQYSRTGFLNSLASELNTIIGHYSGRLKQRDFYHHLHRRFRKEPLDNRFMLLLQLKGMEVNTAYPFHKLGNCRATVRAGTKNMVVNLQVQMHSPAGRYSANCYYFEVVLLCWDNNANPATHSRQYSEWINMDGGLPEFEFRFPRPTGVMHWLVCLKQQLGKGGSTIEAFAAEGMQIAEVGTFNKKDQALWNRRKAEEQDRQQARKKVADVVRVKPKSIRRF